MLTPQSQLLERNLNLFEQGDWVLINPTDAYFTDMLSHRTLTVLHQYFDVFSESVRVIPSFLADSRDIAGNSIICEQKTGNHRHIFAPFITRPALATDVMVFMPKSKAHFSMNLRMAASLIKPGGRIHVVGENKGGIKSAAKIMQEYGMTQKVDSARHCSLLTTQVDREHMPFEPDVWLSHSEYEHADTQWQVISMPGVFSHGELDDGTRLLLDKINHSLSGDVLDFACGAGVVGAYLKSHYPHLRMFYSDVSALALYCTALTLRENQQAGSLYAANGLNGIEQHFNHIVTNPPFHSGIKTDYTITKRFITDSARLLKENGTLQMVANRFLPYPGLLSETFSRVHTVAQNTQFTVYFANR